MNARQENILGPLLFIAIVILYGLYYAPFGINETDGGFISAYAWRMLNGEVPYQDFIYVRPPISLYIRYLEMWLLPDSIEILSERWLFYVKIALANYLGATLLLKKGNYKWFIATLGFVFSSHNYPAAAWHTVDGVWLGALALYGLFKSDRWLFPAVVAAVLSAGSKQSFYPLIPGFILLLFLIKPFKKAIVGTTLMLLTLGGAFSWMYFSGIWEGFVNQSTGATSVEQLLGFGVWAMFRVDPRLILVSCLLIPYLFNFRYPHLFYLFIATLIGFYGFQVYSHTSWTGPLKVCRLLWLLSFGISLFWAGHLLWSWRKTGVWKQRNWEDVCKLLALLALSWMTAISWGLNFPLFLSVPYFYVLGKIAAPIQELNTEKMLQVLRLILLLAMLLVFRFGYEIIYRDEPRSTHTCHLAEIFPKLYGVKSSPATCELYAELDDLIKQYGPTFKTLPSFPLSNYLSNTNSPWPIDWVTAAEIKGLEDAIYDAMDQKGVYYFIEKSYGDLLLNNAKFTTTKHLMQNLLKVEEREYFEVYVKE